MTGLLAATGGFLLAVLWMDLMFDSQARRGGAALDAAALDSITAYGLRTDNAIEQTRLARAVLVDHILCTAGMALFVALWAFRSLN